MSTESESADSKPRRMMANVNQSGLYHGVRGHKRTEQCETLVPPCVESPAPPEPLGKYLCAHGQFAQPCFHGCNEPQPPEPQAEAAAPSLAYLELKALSSANSTGIPHSVYQAVKALVEAYRAELTNLRESHDRLKASYVANPEHWRSRCEMLETEVERLRKGVMQGAMQRTKEWMESAAEALAQENENARLRAELTAERERHAEDAAVVCDDCFKKMAKTFGWNVPAATEAQTDERKAETE